MQVIADAQAAGRAASNEQDVGYQCAGHSGSGIFVL